MANVLALTEIERIKQSVLPEVVNNEKQLRRIQLKALSEERLSHWPNTLEAMRLKKEHFLRDKEEKEELRRQEIDREEAEFRKSNRLAAIQRANELIYQQTDKMKALKSQTLYADVLHDRVWQQEDKVKAKDAEKIRERFFHEETMKQVQDGNMKEEEKIARRKAEMEIVKKSREEQRAEVRLKKEQIIEQERQMGLEMKATAQRRIEEDFEKKLELLKKSAKSNSDMVLANEKILAAREEQKALELLSAAERDRQKDLQEDKKKRLKALEIRRFEKSQETKQKLIDAAVEQMSKFSNSEQTRLANQFNEIKEKEEKAIADKAAKLERDMQLIKESRSEQIRAKQEAIAKEKREKDIMVAKWKEQKEEADMKEMHKEYQVKETTKKVKSLQYGAGVERHRKQIEDRVIQIEQEKLLYEIGKQDDEKFAERCKEKIKEYAGAGKPVITLYRALETTQPAIIPAKRNKVVKKAEE